MSEQMSLEAAIEAVLHHGPTFETIAELCKMAVEAAKQSDDEWVGSLRMGAKQDFVTTKAAGYLDPDVWHKVYTRPHPAAPEQQINALKNEAWNSGVCPVCNSKDESQPAAWVGLTDDEIHAIYDRVARQEPYSMAVTRRSIGRAIEQALRKKNT